MKRSCLALLVGLLLVVPATAHTNHAPLLAKTVFPLQWEGIDDETTEVELQTHCSTFSVNPAQRSDRKSVV